MASNEEALEAYPIETPIWRELAYIRDRRKVFVDEVYDYRDPYWRVRYPGGDWEQLATASVWTGCPR